MRDSYFNIGHGRMKPGKKIKVMPAKANRTNEMARRRSQIERGVLRTNA